MAYYTLITRDTLDTKWYPQFGDHDRAVVEMERRDCYAEFPRGSWKIIKTPTARQLYIDAALAALNEPVDDRAS